MMNTVHLLEVSFLSDDTLFQRYYDRLSAHRKAKTDRYRHRKDKNLSVGAGILLDYCLQPFGKREQDRQYIFGKNEKPFFSDADFFFSISHSETMVAVSFSDSETGCDVQYGEHKNNLYLAKRFFTACEYDTLLRASDPEMTFYRMWAIKESYLKFTGQGIGGGLDFFDVRFHKNSPLLFKDGKQEDVFIKEYRYENYFVAVCGRKDEFSIQYHSDEF